MTMKKNNSLKLTLTSTLLTLLSTVLILAYPVTGFAAKYKGGAVSNGGSVTGKLSFKGSLPKDAIDKIAITKNPDVCDKDPKNPGYREIVWVDVKGGALRGAFVYIDKIKAGKKWAKPKGGKYIIEQKGCRFMPWAQVIEPGSVTIRHSDGKDVLHNINTREMIGVEKGRVVKRTMFNFGQPDPGDIIKKIKPRRAPHIALNCEAHNFMFGFMMAPKNPYAVVVKADGSYTLDNVPPGTYTIKAWHPRLGVQKMKVTVPAKGKVQANFTFSSK